MKQFILLIIVLVFALSTTVLANHISNDVEYTLNNDNDSKYLFSKKEKVIIYPNPATVQINIKSLVKSDISKIEVYNILGTQIQTVDASGKREFSVNVRSYKKGKYLVRVYFKDGSTDFVNFVKV